MTEINVSVVIGAGIMGHGIAQLMAAQGLKVHLVDRDRACLNRARGWIEDNLSFMIELGEPVEGGPEKVLDNIDFTPDLAGALPEADFVIEAVNEDFELKRRIWISMGLYASSKAVLASNTSSYDINELTATVPFPGRIVGTHWFHPPQITPCVEVIPCSGADPEKVDLVLNFLTWLGKVPTLCKSTPGFVANRIQLALVAEALSLVEEGLAEPEEVDQIVKNSFGFRLGAYGPFEVIDQAGADTYLGVYEYLYKKLGREHFRPSEVLKKQVEMGRLGLKSSGGFYDYEQDAADLVRRDRDRKLYARLRLLHHEAQAG